MGKLKCRFISFIISFMLSVVWCTQSQAYTFKTFKSELASPFEKPASWVLIGGTAATLIAFPFDHHFQDEAIGRTHHYNNFSVISGTLIPNLTYIIGMETASLFDKDDHYDDLALIMVKASAFAVGTTILIKNVVREPRPDGADKFSFPSGHSAAAFSFASVIAEEHPWYFGVPAYAFATIAAYSRTALNRHRLHDVIAGATIGISYGVGIAHQYALRYANSDSPAPAAFDFHVRPSDELDGLIALATYQF